jgi:hypothetical protein
VSGCLERMKKTLGEWSQAPPSEYRKAGEDALRLVIDDVEELDCDCNEGLMDSEEPY